MIRDIDLCGIGTPLALYSVAVVCDPHFVTS
jgi:hypothetical protein